MHHALITKVKVQNMGLFHACFVQIKIRYNLDKTLVVQVAMHYFLKVRQKGSENIHQFKYSISRPFKINGD